MSFANVLATKAPSEVVVPGVYLETHRQVEPNPLFSLNLKDEIHVTGQTVVIDAEGREIPPHEQEPCRSSWLFHTRKGAMDALERWSRSKGWKP